MVAEIKGFPLEEWKLTPGLQITIVALKADGAKLAQTQATARQKLQDGQPLSSEERASLIIEKEDRVIAERAARQAKLETERHSLGARFLRALGEIW